VWTGGFGGVQSFNGGASVGSADARTAVAGGAMGLDYQVDPTQLVGVAVGGHGAPQLPRLVSAHSAGTY
jgi:uncharacterized protein with beta-barrel porin domain